MTRTSRGLAVAIVVPVVLVGALSACSGKKQDDTSGPATTDRPTVEVTAQPQDAQSAQVVAQQVVDNLSEGDWAGAWELWTDTAKAAIAQDAYVELAPTCPALQGTYVVVGMAPVDDSTATVKWSRTPAGGAATPGSATVRYQGGAWKYEPDAAALAAYKQNKCP